MTTQQTTAANIALVRSSLDAFNDGDIDACAALLSPDFVMNMAGRIADGRFAEEWICSDTATLHAQLTAGTDPSPAAR